MQRGPHLFTCDNKRKAYLQEKWDPPGRWSSAFLNAFTLWQILAELSERTDERQKTWEEAKELLKFADWYEDIKVVSVVFSFVGGEGAVLCQAHKANLQGMH